MDKKLLTCLVCPMGCRLKAKKVSLLEGIYNIEGNKCSKGKVYALQELTHPTRMLTTTITIKDAVSRCIPVRTVDPIPKNLIRQCINFLKEIEIEAPVQIGETVIKDILGTGVDVVASRSMRKKKL